MSESTHIPVTKPSTTTTSPMHSTIARGRVSNTHTQIQTQSDRRHEQKEPISETATEGIQQVKRVGTELYEKACDACHHWRHYPKLVTSVLLISCFLFGALSSMAVNRAWLGGGGRHYVSSHWDRETADAHHALDVMLDHLKYPESYQAPHHESLINRARDYLGGIFSGVLPGRRKGYTEELYDKGREYYDKATGRTYYDKATGRGVTDKLSDVGQDIAYGARRGFETAKEKLSDVAEGVKGTLGGGRDYESGYGSRMGTSGGGGGWFGGGGGGGNVERRRAPSSGSGIMSWFGSSDEEYKPRGYEEEDDIRLAREKMKNIVRTAEREL